MLARQAISPLVELRPQPAGHCWLLARQRGCAGSAVASGALRCGFGKPPEGVVGAWAEGRMGDCSLAQLTGSGWSRCQATTQRSGPAGAAPVPVVPHTLALDRQMAGKQGEGEQACSADRGEAESRSLTQRSSRKGQGSVGRRSPSRVLDHRRWGSELPSGREAGKQTGRPWSHCRSKMEKTTKKKPYRAIGSQVRCTHHAAWLLPQSPAGRKDQPRPQLLQDPVPSFTHLNIPRAAVGWGEREGG